MSFISQPINCIYVTASAHDARFTRVCIASVRHFYPDIPIKLLIGGELQSGLLEELEHHWDVQRSDIPPGEWGWGFVKLEPLFQPPGEKFFVLDSDTVLTGPVLDRLPANGWDFLMDEEGQADDDIIRIYFDWAKAGEKGFISDKPHFVANTGQWAGTSGILTREDFSDLVDWSKMPPRSLHSEVFKNGDQGVLNYVLNRKDREGSARIVRQKIMHWPGHGMIGYDLESLESQKHEPRVIHWAGLKRHKLTSMPGSEILQYFERAYYRNIPLGSFKRVTRALRYWLSSLLRDFTTRASQRLENSLAALRSSREAP